MRSADSQVSGHRSRPEWWSIAAVLVTLAMSGFLIAHLVMPDRRWVPVLQVRAATRWSTSLDLVVGMCGGDDSAIVPKVVESREEVRVSIPHRIVMDGDMPACALGRVAKLASPLGNRHVVDGNYGRVVTVFFADGTTNDGT